MATIYVYVSFTLSDGNDRVRSWPIGGIHTQFMLSAFEGQVEFSILHIQKFNKLIML